MEKPLLDRLRRVAEKAGLQGLGPALRTSELIDALTESTETEAVGHLVDGILKEWDREHEVNVSKGEHEYHIVLKSGRADFCRRIKRTAHGATLCRRCEAEYSTTAAQKATAIAFTCHAGVQCVAAPICIDGKHLATIFLGEHILDDAESRERSEKLAIGVAKELDIPIDELLGCLSRLLETNTRALESTREKLSALALKLGIIEAKRRAARAASIQICAESLLFQVESSVIQDVMPTLSTIGSVEDFWPKLSVALEKISNVIGASIATFFVSKERSPKIFELKATSGIDRSRLRKEYTGNNFSFGKISDEGKPRVVPFDPTHPNTLCGDLATISARIDKVALIPFQLSGKQSAIMIFLLAAEEDVSASLPIDTEAIFLARFAPQIATAYQNSKLYTQDAKKKEEIGRTLTQKRKELAERQSELATLGEVGEALTRTIDPKDALQFIADTAASLMRADIVTVIPYIDKRRVFDLDMAACFGIQKEEALMNRQPRPDGTLAKIRDQGILPVSDTSDLKKYPFLSSRPEAFIRRLGIRAFLGARLHVGEEDVGVLYMNFKEHREFSKKDIDAVTRLASHVAPSIKAARSSGESLRHMFELSTLNEIGNEISLSTIFEKGAFLEKIYRQTSILMNTDNFYVAFYDDDEQSVEFALAYEENRLCEIGKDEWRPRRCGNGMTEYIIRTRKPLLVAERFDKWLDENGVEAIGKEAKSWLGAPMIAEGRVLGVIGIQSYTAEHIYDEHHKSVLSTIALQAACAFRIRRLIDEVNQANCNLHETKARIERMIVETFSDTGNRFAGKLFFDTVSHDLRNFVTVTESTLEQILDGPTLRDLSKTAQRRLKTLIDRARKSSDTIDGFIGMVADFEPEFEFCDLNGVVRQVLALQSSAIEEGDVSVQPFLPESIPPVYVNSLQVTMVIFNLIANALKAIGRTGKPGRLAVSTRESKDKKYVEVIIEDDGCGIRSNEIQKIFEPYYSGEGSRGGRGLGLFGCKELLKSMGGVISVNSRYGRGSTFTVGIPQRPSEV